MELHRLNKHYINQEGEALLRLTALTDQLDQATTGSSPTSMATEGSLEGANSLQAIATAAADFHGELVLLLHWSLLNRR